MDQLLYHDKILPNQKWLTNLYNHPEPVEQRILNLLVAFNGQTDIPVSELARPGHIGVEQMSTPPNVIGLFALMIKLAGHKTVLEVGTFIGKTTMKFADMVGPDGHVTTIEAGKEFAVLAQQNFERHGYANRITSHQGDAHQVLEELGGEKFDFIFIDGGKEHYLPFTKRAIDLVSEQGLIIVDDIFFNGDALNDEATTEKGAGCWSVLDHFRDYDRCSKLVIPECNGLLVLYDFKQE